MCKRKVLKEEAQKRATFKPMLMAREVVAADPGAGRKTILKRAKALVMTLDDETRLNHDKSFSKQGQIHHFVPIDATALWANMVLRLPPECMKFVLMLFKTHSLIMPIWQYGIHRVVPAEFNNCQCQYVKCR